MDFVMLNTLIRTLKHENHRYPTVGDYYRIRETNHIYVSEMKDWRYELLVAVHELIEQALCEHRGIPEELITKFDQDFESNREEFDTSEPGDSPGAPYRKEHFFATSVERLLASELGVDWKDYEETINSL
jgi:hypothetical protein